MPSSLEEAISQLPATPTITYRGMSGPPPRAAFTLTTILPTSADPRIATENFTSERVAAIVTLTGRSIAALSRHPDELEIVILPGTLLLPVGAIDLPELAEPVVVLAETGWAPGLPEDRADLERRIVDEVTRALARPPTRISSPGRFTPPRG